jgi:sigma-E factor negative regulatory protein RseA
MNAQQNNAPIPAHDMGTDDALADPSGLSAWLDGELRGNEFEGWLASDAPPAELAVRWHTYQLIGESLRGQAVSLPAQAPAEFLAAVQDRLRHEPDASRAPLAAPVSAAPSTHHVRGGAANDALFRWKLVAGMASLAAVVAVSWTVLDAASGGGGNAASPQLALMGAPAKPVDASAVAVGTVSGTEPVKVNTRQGVLIRDAQLEALLAEHRQFGGVSALQMPAGFLRNATYDTSGR